MSQSRAGALSEGLGLTLGARRSATATSSSDMRKHGFNRRRRAVRPYRAVRLLDDRRRARHRAADPRRASSPAASRSARLQSLRAGAANPAQRRYQGGRPLEDSRRHGDIEQKSRARQSGRLSSAPPAPSPSSASWPKATTNGWSPPSSATSSKPWRPPQRPEPRGGVCPSNDRARALGSPDERSAIRGSLSIGPGLRVPLRPATRLSRSFRLRYCERPQGRAAIHGASRSGYAGGLLRRQSLLAMTA